MEIVPPFDLTAKGGHGFFPEPGLYTFTASVTDELGRVTTASASIQIYPVVMDKLFNPDGATITWSAQKDGAACIIDLSTLDNDGGMLAMFEEGTYTITATVRDDAGNLTSAFANITVTNTAPVIESFTANATRNMKDGRFYADLNAVASDPDGDTVHLEWSSGYQQDGYYEVGTHTIRVRAVDELGAASAWESRTIEFINNAPVITSFTASVTRQARGNNFLANISATGSADGDTVTLEWGGDYNSSGWYSRNGFHTIRARAVDSYGAASAWQEKTIEFVNQAPSKPVISRNPANGVVRPSQAVTINVSSTDCQAVKKGTAGKRWTMVRAVQRTGQRMVIFWQKGSEMTNSWKKRRNARVSRRFRNFLIKMERLFLSASTIRFCPKQRPPQRRNDQHKGLDGTIPIRKER